MRNIANENLSTDRVHLGMALETKIVVTLDKHLVRNRAVGLMTDGAAFAQGFMFVDDHARLFAMALCASFIEPSQAGLRTRAKGCVMRSFEDIRAVWIVALHAIHPGFQDRMMVGQSELGLHVDMTIQASRWFPSRIDNELAATTAALHVQAPRPMTRLAAHGLGAWRTLQMESGMRTGRKDASQIRMAIDACLIADKRSSFNRWRGQHGVLKAGTGNQNNSEHACTRHNDGRQNAASLHAILRGCPGVDCPVK